MVLENKVRTLLTNRPSYLKCGALRIAGAIGINRPASEDLSQIKSIKKAVNKELKYGKNEVVRVEALSFEDQFKLMAEKLGYIKPDDSPSSFSKINANVNNFKKLKVGPIQNPPSIQKQVGMHILLGCSHVPFHNVKMHDGILELIGDFKDEIKGFHLMGDFMDLNTLSFHDRGKHTAVPGLTLNHEYSAGNYLLDQLDNALSKKTWKTYLYGNHEDRHKRWMHSSDNAKTPLMSPKNALGLYDRGYHVKTNWSQDFFTIGKHLDILHGIYFSIHCAKAHMDKLRGSCAFVHTHRIQQYIEGNTGSFNIGAGADFKSPAFNYATRPMKASWQNGFAVVMVEPDGSYNLTQIICRNGSFYFGGKKY